MMRGVPGQRVFRGRYYVLAGRGTRAHCAQQAEAHRRHWRYVRVVPARPYTRAADRLDDWMIYVFEAKLEAQT